MVFEIISLNVIKLFPVHSKFMIMTLLSIITIDNVVSIS